MLERAHFQNYRCLRDVTIDFGPLTVLVGPNGSGKSSVLRGLLPGSLSRPADFWQHRQDLPTKVELHYPNSQAYRKVWDDGSIRETLPKPLGGHLLHLDLAALRRPNTAQRATILAENGSNLTNVFDTCSRTEQAELASQFGRLVPTFKDVDVEPLGGGQQQLLFQDRWASDVQYTASEVSDGTMLVLAYLVLQYQKSPVDLLLVEEPERGLHPYLLGTLVKFLRKMSRGEVGPKAIQLVLATHSADLLDHLDPSEVRFLTRDPKDGSVRVDTVPGDTEAWQKTYRNYDESLGSIWKSGSLRGVPGG